MTVAGVPGARPGVATARIIFYYVVLAAVVVLVVWRFPQIADFLTRPLENLADPATQGVANQEITQTFADEMRLTEPPPTGLGGLWAGTVTTLGALLIMIPVTWSYILIKRETGYEESVVHTLLILPVAVAGIVIVVKGDIALAFSLAGIVAAVRFRTTLNDTKDAVYVFLAIGVGLAAGAGLLSVALALSIVFNVVNMLLWRLNFGNVYADQMHRTGGLGLGTAIAGPSSSRSAVGFGDRKVMVALAPDSLDEVAQAQARMRHYLEEESEIKKERKQYFALILYTRDVPAVQEVVEPVLEEWALRWQVAEILPGQNGVSAITYLVRLKDGVTEKFFISAVEASDDEIGDAIRAAELRSLREIAQGG
ncbi:MAG: DUF4956 domain-containing protein [Gemmatimonadales bacterium]|jgi:hypothetical protein|nr:MAG: DUF4956 domain-containing protein [Gemmatimonadales bacterium]